MKSIAISGSPRENVGKRDAKELRYKGLVPAVLYGGKSQIHFSVSAADLKGLVFTPDVQFVDIDVAGVKVKAIVQDVDFHPLTSPGVKTGGKLIQKLRKLRVRSLPKDMPQYVEVSIESLEVGKSVGVDELKFDNFKIMNNPDDTIVSVTLSRALKQAETEAKGK